MRRTPILLISLFSLVCASCVFEARPSPEDGREPGTPLNRSGNEDDDDDDRDDDDHGDCDDDAELCDRLPGPVDLLLIWDSAVLHDWVEPTLLRADFDAGEFTLENCLPASPPENALKNHLGEPRIAEGYIVGVVPGTLDDPDAAAELSTLQDRRIIAGVKYYAVVYVESEIPVGSEVEHHLCGQLAPGYHVVAGEQALFGDFADCPEFGSGTEENGALWAVTADDLDTVMCASPRAEW